MSQEGKPDRTSPEIVAAVSRLAGAHAAAFGLAVTYLAAVLSGASAPTALLRASLAALVFHILGRFAGNLMARHLVPATPTSAAKPEAHA